MQIVPVLSVFSTGELSPLYAGRVDLPAYYKGCSQLENFLLMRQGGVTRRPGTYYIDEALYDTSSLADSFASDANNRFIPWIVDDTEGFAIEVAITGAMTTVSSTGYAMRFFKSDSHSLVMTSALSADPFYISLPTFGAAWNIVSDSYDLTTANWLAVSCDAVLSDEYYTGKRFTEITTLAVWPAVSYIYQSLTFTGDGQKALQGIARKGTSHQGVLQLYDASLDTILAEAKINWATKAVTAAYGTLQETEWLDDETLFIALISTNSLIAANTNWITLDFTFNSLNATEFWTELRAGDVIPSKYVGQGTWDTAWAGYWKYQHLQVKSAMYFVHERSPIYKLTKYGGHNEDFSLSEVSMAGVPFTDMYKTPRAIGFHHDRILLASTGDEPDTTWGSVTGDHEDFSLGALAEQGIKFGIGQVTPAVIKWVMGTDALVIGTDIGEAIISTGEEGLTPASTKNFNWRSTHGCCGIQPILINEALVFVQ